MGARIRSFAAFWYDFVIGDDWHVAAIMVAALALTALLVHAAGVVISLALTYALSQAAVPAWWLVPLFLVLLLPVSLWRATRRGG